MTAREEVQALATLLMKAGMAGGAGRAMDLIRSDRPDLWARAMREPVAKGVTARPGTTPAGGANVVSSDAFGKKIEAYLASGQADTIEEAYCMVQKDYPILYQEHRRNPEVPATVIKKAVPARPKSYAETSLDAMVEQVQKAHPHLTRAQAQDAVLLTPDGKKLWEMRKDQFRAH